MAAFISRSRTNPHEHAMVLTDSPIRSGNRFPQWLYFAAQVAEKNIQELSSVNLRDIDPKIELLDTMPEIPDYFFDKHTAKGRALGRDQRHWFHYCCRVNHYFQLPDDFKHDPLRDGFNEICVKEEGGMKLEYLVFPEGRHEVFV